MGGARGGANGTRASMGVLAVVDPSKQDSWINDEATTAVLLAAASPGVLFTSAHAAWRLRA
jgi:hypothetical protein